MSTNTGRMILEPHPERKFHWVGTGAETPLKVAELVNNRISLMNEYIYDSATHDQILGIRVDKDPIPEEDQATFDLWMTDRNLRHEFRIGDHLYFAGVYKVLLAKEYEAVRNTPNASAFILMRVLEIKSKYFSQHAPKDFVKAIANKGFFHGCKGAEEGGVEIAMTKQVLALSPAAREKLLQHRYDIFEEIPNAASTYGLDPEVLADLAIIEARANAPAPASDLYIKHVLGAETAAKYGEPNVGDKADK